MIDTVTKLMGLADEYRNAGPHRAQACAKALQDELVRLFTPLTDEQVKRMAKVGPAYAPDGWVKRRPDEYRREIEKARAAGIHIAEEAHGITGESNGPT